VLISSVLQILDGHQVQAKPYPERHKFKSHAASTTEKADRPETFIRAQDRKEGSAAAGSSQPIQTDHGNSDAQASRQMFSDFLRAVEEVTRRPPAPVLDVFQ